MRSVGNLGNTQAMKRLGKEESMNQEGKARHEVGCTKMLKKALSAVTAIVLAVGLCPVVAHAESGGNDATGQTLVAAGVGAQSNGIASGTWGTCAWRIDADGTLTFGAGAGECDEYGVPQKPWGGYADRITAITSSGRVVLPEGCWTLFQGLSNLKEADLSGFDSSNVTNMCRMFDGCKSLGSLSLAGWDASRVTDTSSMFWGCKSLKSLDLAGFDTSNVEDMGAMFAYCSSLESIDLTNFSTASAASMARMFEACGCLTELDLSSFDTSGASSMFNTFAYCYGLQKVTVGERFSFMRGGSDEGAVLPGVSWLSQATGSWLTPEEVADTRSGIADTYTRPAGQDVARGTWGTCEWAIDSDFTLTIGAGTGADVTGKYNYNGNTVWKDSSFKAVKASGPVLLPENCAYLFADCTSLAAFDSSGFDASKVTSMNSMFRNCPLVDADLSSFDTSSVTDMENMFACYYDNSSLRALDLSSFDTSNVAKMTLMFAGQDKLETIYVGDGWSTENVADSGAMFANCRSLVGGNGTAYDSGHVDAGYARVDSTGSPGYLTDKSSGKKVSIANAAVAGVKDKTYTGKALTQSPVVKLGGKTLKAGADYAVSYKNNVRAGKATMTIGGTGSYIGSRSVTFAIAKADVKAAKAAKVAARKYTGKAIKPNPKLAYKGKTLKKGVDYTLSYKNNKKRGTATITVKGKGNFTGAKVMRFKIK